MDFHENEFAEYNSTLPMPLRKAIALGQSPPFEGGQVVGPSELVYNHELLGGNSNLVLPATFVSDGSFDTDRLHFPFFAPNHEANFELLPIHDGMNPSLHQNSMPTIPLEHTFVLAGNPGPQGPVFMEGVFDNYHPPADLQNAVSMSPPLAASSASSATVTPELATPPVLSGFGTAQPYEAEAESPSWPQLVGIKLEPQLPAANSIRLPTLPDETINNSVRAAPGPSSASTGVDRRKSSSKKASRAPKQPKPYTPCPRIPCTVDNCQTTFQDMRARNRHIRSIHDGTRYFCPGLCKETGFSREDALNRHLRNLDDKSECKKTARMLGWDPRCKGSVNNLCFLSPGFDA